MRTLVPPRACPRPEISMPSTKITLPEGVDPSSLHPVTGDFVEPEEPHSPLIFMTVLTQIGLGGFAAIYAVDLLRSLSGAVQLAGTALGTLAAVLMGLIGLSLTASTLHLGRTSLCLPRDSQLAHVVAVARSTGTVAFCQSRLCLCGVSVGDRRFGMGECGSLGWSRCAAVVGGGSDHGGHRWHLRQRPALSGAGSSSVEFPARPQSIFLPWHGSSVRRYWRWR